MKGKLSLSLLLLFLVNLSVGQKDSLWNVLVLAKGHKLEKKANMEDFSTTGFYLYKNCVYDIDLKNEQRIGGRLVNIKKDTLFFTNYFNKNAALASLAMLDTIAVTYADLNRLNLIADRALGIYNKYGFSNFDLIFNKDTTNYYFKSHWVKLYTNDTAKYEVVAHMTEQGINNLFEENGRTYFYQGSGMTKPDYSDFDDSYDKQNFISFTPCNVEEINGIAIGLHPKNIKNEMFNSRDSLIIRGLNLEINPLALISMLGINITGIYADSINIYREKLAKDWRVKINGVNISLVNTVNEMQIRGLNLTGLVTVVDEIHGVSISGLTNFSYIMKGISIAALRNRATLAKGVQIGLVNKATELRGFQFGLWNINGRRSLPFINWQFKPSKKKQKTNK